jgi:PIN domain nuclease of toxin-antitoxin system
MRLLLDSHILLAIQRRDTIIGNAAIDTVLRSNENDRIVSAASLWVVALKYRLGKLALAIRFFELPDFCLSLKVVLLGLNHRHAVEEPQDAPPTRDPFDRLLLAQCQVEGLRLVTLERSLMNHPLVWRER